MVWNCSGPRIPTWVVILNPSHSRWQFQEGKKERPQLEVRTSSCYENLKRYSFWNRWSNFYYPYSNFDIKVSWTNSYLLICPRTLKTIEPALIRVGVEQSPFLGRHERVEPALRCPCVPPTQSRAGSRRTESTTTRISKASHTPAAPACWLAVAILGGNGNGNGNATMRPTPPPRKKEEETQRAIHCSSPLPARALFSSLQKLKSF